MINDRPMWLLPKEHGAYGQVFFPLLTAWAVAGLTAASGFAGAALVSGFLAHEPLMVVLGARGGRERREQGARARRILVGLAGVTVCAAAAAVWLTAPPARVWFAAPLAPALVASAAVAAQREKTWYGEVSVALTFSLAAVPLCLAAGGTAGMAVLVAIPYAVCFVGSTLAVRAVILRVRGGGDLRRARRTRTATLVFVVFSLLALGLTAWLGRVSWGVLVASTPGLVAATALALLAPPPTRLRTVGWSLVATSVCTAALIFTAAR